MSAEKHLPNIDRPRLYGRRSGHKLRRGRRQLMENLLPRLRLEPPPAGGRLAARDIFSQPVEDLWLEVGFGAGEHLAAQAAAHPGIGMIGCETFVNGIAGLLAHIEREKVANIRIFDDDARLLFPLLPDASIGRTFVLFADPWPKKRHFKRRFIADENLDELARLLKDGAELRFASDHMGYVGWTLERLGRHPAFAWTAKGPQDWRRRPEDGFETRYEAKALQSGATCAYLQFTRLPRRPVSS